MKIQFKHQRFQEEAAKAVCDVFSGQPCKAVSYRMDAGRAAAGELQNVNDMTGFNNFPLVPELDDHVILENMHTVQHGIGLEPSERLEGRYNLTIEMETGVGKTYTYIKTMYELNKRYGWLKFIVVVPSVAIREGVYKTLQMTQDHFADEYHKKIRFFIYNSANLPEVEQFASDSNINVMIINSQAFNARGKDARRIYMKLDEFRSRRPIDIIAKTNPILVIDEPQSVEGDKTKERLKDFCALFTLRYSATHRILYNRIYRLDAMDAYNQKLVKKIGVKAVTVQGSTGTEGYLYLESINVSTTDWPTATIEFECKGKTGLKKIRRTVNEKFSIFDNSNGIEAYRSGYVVSRIDGRDNSIELVNGLKLFAGDMRGLNGTEDKMDEDLRRVQIRETIISHIENERILFRRGIKVLSLFFIDEVEKYRVYSTKLWSDGLYAQMFEEEYDKVVSDFQSEFGDNAYIAYLKKWPASKIHAGYFSRDKKSGNFVNSSLGDKKERTSDDTDAYDLIMKDKERLLDLHEPVRFIFSHSALREGWDNPNVFQICTLKKQSESDIRSRQEIGRGLRLCVNQNGERMDVQNVGEEVHDINRLTVITDWKFETFVKNYQLGLAEVISDRPVAVTQQLFENRIVTDADGNKAVISRETAEAIMFDLVRDGYVDRKGVLTETFCNDKKNGCVQLAAEAAPYREAVLRILGSVYNPAALAPENDRANDVFIKLQKDKLEMKEFKQLWSRINRKSAYTVSFDPSELAGKAVQAVNLRLFVDRPVVNVQYGDMDKIESKSALESGTAFVMQSQHETKDTIRANSSVKYDLVGKIVEQTGLTRADIVHILSAVSPVKFDLFRHNPEEFIIKVSNLINEEKATAIVEHITYNLLDEHYEKDIFTEPGLKVRLGVNAVGTRKNLYDCLRYDSDVEKKFAEQLDTHDEVAVYVKLPKDFYISTPVGHYNPDWAIAFKDGTVKHIYFVAETKGDMSTLELKGIEDAKISCARKHFEALSTADVKYEVVDSYEKLLAVVRE
jgi:type III restriction enzyme